MVLALSYGNGKRDFSWPKVARGKCRKALPNILSGAGSNRLRPTFGLKDITSEGLEDACKITAELVTQEKENESAQVCSMIIPVRCVVFWKRTLYMLA